MVGEHPFHPLQELPPVCSGSKTLIIDGIHVSDHFLPTIQLSFTGMIHLMKDSCETCNATSRFWIGVGNVMGRVIDIFVRRPITAESDTFMPQCSS